MARDNYKFAKRGREIAKKKKQEEKLQRKLAKSNPETSENVGANDDSPVPGAKDDGGEGTESES